MESSTIYGHLSICTIGVALNVLQIALLLHQRRTKLPFDVTLISLALANFVVSLAPMVIYLFLIANISLTKYLIYVLAYIYTASNSTSALHLVYIALQRLIAVSHPHKFSTWLTRKSCVTTLGLFWLVPILLVLPLQLDFTYSYYKFYIHIPLLLGVIIFLCYAALNYYILTRRRISIRGQSSSRSFQLLVYSTVVTLVYLICTFPITILLICAKDRSAVPLYASYLYVAHVVLDPLLYFLFQYFKSRNSSRRVRNLDATRHDSAHNHKSHFSTNA